MGVVMGLIFAVAIGGGITLGMRLFGDNGIFFGTGFGVALGCLGGVAVSRCRCCLAPEVIEAQQRRSSQPVLATDVAKLPLRTASLEDVESASTSAGSERGSSFASGASGASDTSVSFAGTPGCAICLEAFGEGDQQRTLPCFHIFHARCVDNWLSTSSFCPTCRHDVTISDLTENCWR